MESHEACEKLQGHKHLANKGGGGRGGNGGLMGEIGKWGGSEGKGGGHWGWGLGVTYVSDASSTAITTHLH